MQDWRAKAQSRVAAKGGPDESVLCPECETPMTRRNSARGEFWGCSKFPMCRGTRKVGEENKFVAKAGAGYDPIVKLPGSSEQEDIWDFLLHDRPNVVVSAGPGTGKTWTAIQYCLRAPASQRICIVAFNRHIIKEANGKLAASKIMNAEGRTYNSLGWKILRENFKNLGDPDESKMKKIFEGLCPPPVYGRGPWRKKINLAEKLASFVKSYLVNYHAPSYRSEMERIADHHAIDFDGDFNEAVDLVVPALDRCVEMASTSVDYDDQIWLPIVLNLKPRCSPHVLITDESQDLNAAQHELMSLVGAQRLVAIGDPHQSIYGFRGALTDSFSRLTEKLRSAPNGVQEFPLTITRRCPKLHVMMALQVFPNCARCGRPESHHVGLHRPTPPGGVFDHPFVPSIQALPDAPLGEVISMKKEKAVEVMKPGDMVMCRVNAELIGVAYALIRRKIRPVIKGRDFGRGLSALVDKLEEKTLLSPLVHGTGEERARTEISAFREALSAHRFKETERLLKLEEKGEGRLSNLQDMCDCMLQFIANAKSVAEIRKNIEDLFKDEIDAANSVTLGTVHRTKGLEAERVFILAPELIPHPMARRDWEKEQERNLAWVAMTRAKFDNKTGACGTVIFCGAVPPIFSTPPEEPAEFDDEGSDPMTCSSEELLALSLKSQGIERGEFERDQAAEFARHENLSQSYGGKVGDVRWRRKMNEIEEKMLGDSQGDEDEPPF